MTTPASAADPSGSASRAAGGGYGAKTRFRLHETYACVGAKEQKNVYYHYYRESF